MTDNLKRQEGLLALTEISQVINSTLELDEVLRIVMDTIVQLTQAERGFLMLRSEQGDLAIRVARNWEKASLDPSEFAISRTVINRVVTEGQPVLTTNAREDPRFGSQDSIVIFNLRSILCVPLKVKGELTGVIYADNRVRSGIFTESDRYLLATFANQAAIAIENARLFASVRRTLAEVTELKNLMDNVFASIASGVLTTDLQNRITLCNQAAQSILGINNAVELVGQNLHEILPPVGRVLAQHATRVRQTGQNIIGLELSPVLPQRGPISLRLHFSPLIDANQATQGIAIVLEDLTERKQLRAQLRLFERMVSPAVIEQLDPDQLQLGGKRVEITTLFADIRGFTGFSESTDPERLVSVLNCYLAAAADAVLAQEGTIDKFLGDAIMAWFNAPILQPDHTMRAVRAALSLQEAASKLRCQLPVGSQLDFGVGIHTGEAVLGLVGAETRMEYTAIGDSVNTARRIQENAAAGQVLISATVYDCISNQVEVRPVQPIHAKGKQFPIQVYEVISIR